MRRDGGEMMQSRTKLRIAALFAVAGVACGGAEAQTPTRDHTLEATQHVKDTLASADELARDYGRKHLGHYLDLNARRLEKAGLEIPSQVILTVETGHYGYCITAVSEELPSMHPWARATTGTDTRVPNPADKCPKR